MSNLAVDTFISPRELATYVKQVESLAFVDQVYGAMNLISCLRDMTSGGRGMLAD